MKASNWLREYAASLLGFGTERSTHWVFQNFEVAIPAPFLDGECGIGISSMWISLCDEAIKVIDADELGRKILKELNSNSTIHFCSCYVEEIIAIGGISRNGGAVVSRRSPVFADGEYLRQPPSAEARLRAPAIYIWIWLRTSEYIPCVWCKFFRKFKRDSYDMNFEEVLGKVFSYLVSLPPFRLSQESSFSTDRFVFTVNRILYPYTWSFHILNGAGSSFTQKYNVVCSDRLGVIHSFLGGYFNEKVD